MHLIIPEVDTVYTPNHNDWRKTWHGLETVVAEQEIAVDGSSTPEVFCPIVQCGVKPDFDGELATDIPEDLKESLEENDAFKKWKLILADCRQGKSKQVWPLHVPRAGYRIHQNKDLFDCMVKSATEVLGQGGFKVVTVGTLGGYSQFFVSLAIKGQESFTIGKLANGLNDDWKQFFGLNSSHNGLIASTRNLSLIRQVCWNTVNAAIASAEAQDTLETIKHTKESGELITPQVFAIDLQKWIEQGQRVKLSLEAMKVEQMSLESFRAFATGIFTREDSDCLSTTSFNRVTDLEALFAKGQGNEGKSLYDGVNAFTEFFTSGRGVGNPDKVKLNKRIASANFGRGNDWKREALRVASNEKELNICLKRGKRLFKDYIDAEVAAN